jgi:hypothetical protein
MRFEAFCRDEFPGLGTVTGASAEAWIASARRREVRPATLQTLAAPVGELARWLGRRGTEAYVLPLGVLPPAGAAAADPRATRGRAPGHPPWLRALRNDHHRPAAAARGRTDLQQLRFPVAQGDVRPLRRYRGADRRQAARRRNLRPLLPAGSRGRRGVLGMRPGPQPRRPPARRRRPLPCVPETPPAHMRVLRQDRARRPARGGGSLLPLVLRPAPAPAAPVREVRQDGEDRPQRPRRLPISAPGRPATGHSPRSPATCPPPSSPTSSASTSTPPSAGSATHARTGPPTSPPATPTSLPPATIRRSPVNRTPLPDEPPLAAACRFRGHGCAGAVAGVTFPPPPRAAPGQPTRRRSRRRAATRPGGRSWAPSRRRSGRRPRGRGRHG